jgi:hypothetical protein
MIEFWCGVIPTECPQCHRMVGALVAGGYPDRWLACENCRPDTPVIVTAAAPDSQPATPAPGSTPDNPSPATGP